jgi:hypothetical protein
MSGWIKTQNLVAGTSRRALVNIPGERDWRMDKKFFCALGEGESPWKAAGEADLVKMDKIKPFTGSHTPRAALTGKGPAGLVLEALALVEGKEYADRARLSVTIWLSEHCGEL